MIAITTLAGLVGSRLAEKHVTKRELSKLLGYKSVMTLNAKLECTSELLVHEAKLLADFCEVDVAEICELALAGMELAR